MKKPIEERFINAIANFCGWLDNFDDTQLFTKIERREDEFEGVIDQFGEPVPSDTWTHYTTDFCQRFMDRNKSRIHRAADSMGVNSEVIEEAFTDYMPYLEEL